MPSVTSIPASVTDLADHSNAWAGDVTDIQSINTVFMYVLTGDFEPSESNTLRVSFAPVVPADATIVGLAFTYRSLKSDNFDATANLTPRVNGNAGTPEAHLPTTGYVNHIYGGASNLLGLTPTAADINAGVDLDIQISGYLDEVNEHRVDYVGCTVYYTTPSVGGASQNWWRSQLTGNL